MTKQLFWLFMWGIAFGYIEAAVVVYLREIYYPDGFLFPVVIIQGRIMLTELLREAATLILLWATVSLAYRRLQSQFAAFFILFGLWDIFYYVFLKLLLNWPESLGTWDILFLIPLPWVGPVWGPVLVSIAFISAGIVVLSYNHQNRFFYFGKKFILLEILAGLLIIISFLIPGTSVIDQTLPTPFPWYIFLTGFLLGIGTFITTVKKQKV